MRRRLIFYIDLVSVEKVTFPRSRAARMPKEKLSRFAESRNTMFSPSIVSFRFDDVQNTYGESEILGCAAKILKRQEIVIFFRYLHIPQCESRYCLIFFSFLTICVKYSTRTHTISAMDECREELMIRRKGEKEHEAA